MPLHAKAEPARRILDGLDDAVGRDAVIRSVAEPIDRLVMPAVHLQVAASLSRLAEERARSESAST